MRSIIRNTDDRITDRDQRIYPETGYEDEEKYHETVDQKINEVQDSWKKHRRYQVINKQISPCFTYREISDFLIDLYTNHINAFNFNFGLGYILYHTITDKFKYHYVSINNLLFEKAI